MRSFAIILTALLGAATVSVSAAAWNGTIENQDGITTVVNSETPAMGLDRVELREAWRRGGDDDDDVFFGTIAEFLHDAEGNIYLLDGQISQIAVFTPDGELLRTIGRQGEGPGEFQNGADMFWTPSGEIGVTQAWPGKIVMITPDGNPGSAFPLPYRSGGGFQTVSRGQLQGDAVVLSGTAWSNSDGQQLQHTYLKSYRMDGTEAAGYQEVSKPTAFGNYQFVEENWVDFQRRWAVAPDGRVAAALSFDDYRIHIWNADGTLDRVIERPGYPAVARTGEEKDMFQTVFDAFTRWNPGSTFKVSDHHNTVEQILFRDDGSLWVQSSAARWRAPEGIYTSFDVYDKEGRFMRTVDLVADADATRDGLFFAGDRVFVVTDLLDALMARIGGDGNEGSSIEAEPVSVICYDWDAPQVSAR